MSMTCLAKDNHTKFFPNMIDRERHDCLPSINWNNIITPTLNTPTVITPTFNTPTLNTPTVITPTLITPTIITLTLNTSTVTDSLCNSGAFSNPNAVRDCPI